MMAARTEPMAIVDLDVSQFRNWGSSIGFDITTDSELRCLLATRQRRVTRYDRQRFSRRSLPGWHWWKR
jgi:hypothetical protein